MPSVARVEWIIRQLQLHHRTIHFVSGRAHDDSKLKYRVVLHKTDQLTVSPFVKDHLIRQLKDLRILVANSVTLDRGHKYYDGRSEVTFWISEPPPSDVLPRDDPPDTAPLNPDAATFEPRIMEQHQNMDVPAGPAVAASFSQQGDVGDSIAGETSDGGGADVDGGMLNGLPDEPLECMASSSHQGEGKREDETMKSTGSSSSSMPAVATVAVTTDEVKQLRDRHAQLIDTVVALEETFEEPLMQEPTAEQKLHIEQLHEQLTTVSAAMEALGVLDATVEEYQSKLYNGLVRSVGDDHRPLMS